MPVPRAFISSTCYDLNLIRDAVTKILDSYGIESVRSEKGQVFYDPTEHSHNACIDSVKYCNLFILIIGGRFGGEFIKDPEKSITNAEYLESRRLGIPVITFIQKSVLSDHKLYQKNKKLSAVNDLDYPSIEKEQYATRIFDFIDLVCKSRTNNSYEPFENVKDIEGFLKKQLASMLFAYLEEARNKNQQINSLPVSEDHSKFVNDSTSLNPNSGNLKQRTEMFLECKCLIERILDKFKVQRLTISSSDDLSSIARVDPKKLSWHSYLVKTGLFKYIQGNGLPIQSPSTYLSLVNQNGVCVLLEEMDKEVEHIKTSFNVLNTNDRYVLWSCFTQPPPKETLTMF